MEFFAPLPAKLYKVVYADPPWAYQDRREKPGPKGNSAGSAVRHYPTLTIAQLKELPVVDIADDPSLLFMWATWPLMPHWVEVMEAWGFTYKTLAFYWTKVHPSSGKLCMGTGSYTRSNGEPCLLGVRGRGASLIQRHDIVNARSAVREEHSRKPDLFRNLIEMLVGPDVAKIELFARERAPGWDAWGNEV
jgi:site-specific DNA-methyltransferase (adenine-specific)